MQPVRSKRLTERWGKFSDYWQKQQRPKLK